MRLSSLLLSYFTWTAAFFWYPLDIRGHIVVVLLRPIYMSTQTVVIDCTIKIVDEDKIQSSGTKVYSLRLLEDLERWWCRVWWRCFIPSQSRLWSRRAFGPFEDIETLYVFELVFSQLNMSVKTFSDPVEPFSIGGRTFTSLVLLLWTKLHGLL